MRCSRGPVYGTSTRRPRTPPAARRSWAAAASGPAPRPSWSLTSVPPAAASAQVAIRVAGAAVNPVDLATRSDALRRRRTRRRRPRPSRGRPRAAGHRGRGAVGAFVVELAVARGIAGVSQEMLAQTLRTLEPDGLLTREVTPSMPVRVDYALTPLAASLKPVVR